MSINHEEKKLCHFPFLSKIVIKNGDNLRIYLSQFYTLLIQTCFISIKPNLASDVLLFLIDLTSCMASCFFDDIDNNMSARDEQVVKVIIIGDCGVGKTNLLIRFCDDAFKTSYVATIGVDFKIKTITVGKTRVKLQIWDTAGQQRFKNVTQAYYKGAAAIIMVYSLTDQRSYQNIARWMLQVSEHASRDVIKILVANKKDAEDDEKIVSQREGEALASKHDIPWREVSAKTGEGVKELFSELGEEIVRDYLPNRVNQRLRYSLSSTHYIAIKQQKKKCEC